MKVFLKILIVSALMLWLSISSLDLMGRFFIKDTVGLYGSGIVGSDLQVEDASVSWAERSFSLHRVCFPVAATPPLFCAGSALAQFSSDFAPELKRASLFPELWVIDAAYMTDIVLFYDIDSEGNDLNNLRFRLSELSSDAMRDRLNAKAKGIPGPLLIEIKSLQVSGIKVDARSQKTPERSRIFSISDMAFTDVGVQEGGITSAEILDRVTRSIVDRVDAEAEKHGLTETKASQSDGRPSRKRSIVSQDDGAEVPSGKSSPGKALRSIGTGIKKTSQDIWRELFH